MNFLKKLKLWLLYLFVFLLPWQTRLILGEGRLNGGYWEYGTYALYATEILLWLVIIITIIEVICRKLKIKNLKFFYFVGALVFIALISSIQAISPPLAFYWWLRIIGGVAFFLLILFSEVDFKKLSLAFVAGALIQAGLGIWQFVTQSVFASKWLGMAAQIPAALGTSVVEVDSLRFLRAYGSLPHPNMLGVYLVIAIVLLFYCFIVSLNKKKIVTIFFVTCYILLVTCLFFTFSRAAWLGLIIVLLFCCFMVSWKAKKYFIFYALYFMLLIALFWPLVHSRLTGQERLDVKSNIERISGYSESWEIIKDHPWLGVGPGNYTLAVHNKVDSARPAWDYQPVHNVFLLVLAELGIFGLLAFAGLIVWALLRAWRNRQWLSFTLTMVLFILLFFDHFFWSLPFGILLFWFILGASLKKLCAQALHNSL